MKAGAILLAGVVAVSTLAWSVTSTHGAVLLLGGQEGTEDPPQPTEGAETEEDWNPTVTCSVTPPQGIEHLLQCLLDEIANPPPSCEPTSQPQPETALGEGTQVVQHIQADPGEDCYPYPHERQDFSVTLVPPPYFGVEIRRLDDGGEIERISLRENDPGIQTTQLEMERRVGRFARIGEIEESPQGGTVWIIVNDVILKIDTRRSRTAVEVTGDIVRLLRFRGFNVGYQSPYCYVYHERGIYRVQFRSTDPGITKSDIGLFLPDTSLVPLLPGMSLVPPEEPAPAPKLERWPNSRP